jgi:hypothetical protein
MQHQSADFSKCVIAEVSGTPAYAWFVWDKQAPSGQTELKWLKPGYGAQFTPAV